MNNEISHDIKLNRFGLVSIMMLVGLAGLIFLFFSIITSVNIFADIIYSFAIGAIGISVIFLATGFFINDPNQARVIEFFGYYVGTYFESGILITIPFVKKYIVSLKFQNINTEKIKVNDANGSPIEISAVIVWRVDNPAKAYYNVNNYEEFVAIQSESVIRELASNHPYDSEGNEESLRKNSDQIANELKSMLQNRLGIAGVKIVEARISHLAYSSEVAQVMLKRQQAYAITSARRIIVQNAIGIIEDVIAHFDKNKSLKFDEKQKVQLINNLLVALVSDQDAQPTLSLDNDR